MTLSDRLQTELIGPKPKSKCTGVDCPGCDYGRAETALKPKIEAAIANIEADLKGLVKEHLADHEVTCANFTNDEPCDCQIADITAAIEHYCRRDT